MHRVANVRQALQQTGNQEVNNGRAQQRQDHQRNRRGFKQGTHAGSGVTAVEGDDQQPVCARHGGRHEGFFDVVQRTVDKVTAFQYSKIDAFNGLCKRFKRKSRIVSRNHAAVTVQKQAAAGRSWMDPAHVRHHAVHGHIARHHRFQGAILFHRHGESHHQFTGTCINVRRGDDRAVRADHLLIPRANGRVIIRRYARGLREFRRFAGVADINVGESTRLRKLFKHRNRVVTQRNGLGRGDNRHLAFYPVGNRHVMAGAGAGQDIAL